MLNAAIDPAYYADNDDGSEPHGYWVKSADYECREQMARDAKRAVAEGRACWVQDSPNYLPF